MGTRPPPGFLDVGSTLRLFGDEVEPILQRRFAQYIDQPDDRGLDDRIRSKEWILGGGEFKALVRTESDRGRSSDPARLLASARTPAP